MRIDSIAIRKGWRGDEYVWEGTVSLDNGLDPDGDDEYDRLRSYVDLSHEAARAIAKIAAADLGARMAEE